MSNLINFALREEFSKIKTLSRSSNLEEIKKIIDWNKFPQLFSEREVYSPTKVFLLKNFCG